MNRLAVSRLLLALIFAVSGVLHFVFLRAYASTIPSWLPAHETLVIVSGIAELLGATGLLTDSHRKSAGIGLIVLCVAVWPANLQMWLDARNTGASQLWQTALLLRLPLQLPMIVWIAWATRTRGETRRS